MRSLPFYSTIIMLLAGFVIAYSQDSWNIETSGTTQTLCGIAWGNNLYVAVGNAGTLLTSSDAISWTNRSSGTSSGLLAITRSTSLFVAVGTNGTIITSADGVTWTSRSSGTTSGLYGVCIANNMFVAVGANGTIVTSENGVTWTSRSSGTTSNLYSVTWGNNMFVAVGNTGTILTSLNGITWTAYSTGITYTINAVTWANNKFVAICGGGGPLLVSGTNSSFTQRAAPTVKQLEAITWAGDKYIVAGASGTILGSANTSTWTSYTPVTTSSIYGLTFGNSQIVGVGANGLVVLSTLPKLISAVGSDNVIAQAGIDFDDYVLLTFDRAFTTVPVVDATTVNSMFPLSNNHLWTSGFGTINGVQWSPNKTQLIISLTTTISQPTIIVGDTITYLSNTKVLVTGSFGTTSQCRALHGNVHLAFLNAHACVYSIQGKLVAQMMLRNADPQRFFAKPGNYIGNLAKGAYILHLTGENIRFSQPILIE